MRVFACILLSLLLTAPGAARAQTTGEPGDLSRPVAAETREDRLDRLFAELKRATNENAAERIAGHIQREWSRSGSPTIDLLMQWAGEAMEADDSAVALDFLDQAIMLAPTYAEAWNRRATLYYGMRNFAKSMRDIERTLRLEPRHFGALVGMATILRQSGREERALDAYTRILEVYPMLRNAQQGLIELTDELTGQGI